VEQSCWPRLLSSAYTNELRDAKEQMILQGGAPWPSAAGNRIWNGNKVRLSFNTTLVCLPSWTVALSRNWVAVRPPTFRLDNITIII